MRVGGEGRGAHAPREGCAAELPPSLATARQEFCENFLENTAVHAWSNASDFSQCLFVRESLSSFGVLGLSAGLACIVANASYEAGFEDVVRAGMRTEAALNASEASSRRS